MHAWMRGSLRLNPSVRIPRAVTGLDVHLMPGCYHTEFTDSDVAVAAIYNHGTNVFGRGLRAGRRGHLLPLVAAAHCHVTSVVGYVV